MNETRSPSPPGPQTATRLPRLNPAHESYRWIVLGTVMMATFMAVLDATIVNVALPKLMASFGVSVDQVEWVLTAYLLIFGVMLPTSGWLADHFGYKRMFVLGLFFFTSGSFMCSLSQSFDMLIIFRVVQGAGAGFVLPVGMAIIMREFPLEKRGLALGFWGIAASASVSLGPTIGGYLIDRFSWHTIFDVNVPIGIMAIFAAAIVLREHKSPEVRSFDIVGFLSLTAFLTALLLALADGNSAWNTGGWTSRFILTCFAVAAIGLVVFLISEFTAKHPLIDLSLFRSFNFALSSLILFIFGLGVFGSNFLVPIYLQNSLGYTPLQAGLVFLPVGVVQGIVSPFAGLFADRVSIKITPIIGLALLALSLYKFSFLSLFSEHAQIMLPLYIRGFAIALVISPLTTAAISEISNRKMAQASGLINVIRQIGGSFGVAMFGTILTRRTIFHSAAYGAQVDRYSAIYRQTTAHLQHFATRAIGGTAADAAARAKALVIGFLQNQAFIQAVADVFFIAAIVTLLSAAPVFFLRAAKRKKGAKIVVAD
jgi:DHA2 family multidrug resistance protein